MSDGTCLVDGCNEQYMAKGYCQAHYQRWVKTGGDPQPGIPIKIRKRTRGTCSVEGCERPHNSRGWCEPHYHRWQKHGDVMADVPIEDRKSRKGVCRVDGCGRPIGRGARQLCIGHLIRERVHGDVQADVPLKQPSDGACSVEGCGRPHQALTWCDLHYGRYRRYKLTPDGYAALLAEQGGGCAICGVRPDDADSLHVDHDHACCAARKRSCGKCVRGLLCSPCNVMLGGARDDLATLRRGIEYLMARRIDGKAHAA